MMKLLQCYALASWLCCTLLPAVHGAVNLVRTPNGGIQPQAVAGPDGTVHLVYFKGDPRAGDLFYVQRPAGSNAFSTPIQVNRQPGSAVAAGTIRGAQLALGRNGRLHVAWNGSQKVTPGDHHTTPLLYTRSTADGSGFEAERDVITFARGLDGGSSIAADDQGNVFVVWHAPIPGEKKDETGRGVFLARSTNDGTSFERETWINPEPTGACGCCGLKAHVKRDGALFVLYRAAERKSLRDQILMMRAPGAKAFTIIHRDLWKTFTCPMSSASFGEGASGVVAAWETQGKIVMATVDPGNDTVALERPRGSAKRRLPVVVANQRGQTLVAWTEGTGWKRGGDMGWRIFGGAEKPDSGTAEGVPVWGLVTAVAERDGAFTIIY